MFLAYEDDSAFISDASPNRLRLLRLLRSPGSSVYTGLASFSWRGSHKRRARCDLDFLTGYILIACGLTVRCRLDPAAP